ncbi:unnamed protein product [Scytosiphon promiscuus]
MLSMSPSKRRDTDMMKLMMSDFEVHIPDESSMHDFLVAFPGPEDTPYEGGVWKVHVTLPKEYPFKSPSIGFENRMFHPNVDEMSGSVCLDVINQTWSPMFDLVNIFKLFIPQLLSYPNPTDPLNGEAAALLMRDPKAYENRIRDCVRLHASDPVHLDGTPVVAPAATATATTPATPANASAGSGSGGGAAGVSAGAPVASAGSSATGAGGGSSGAAVAGASSNTSSTGDVSEMSSADDKPPAVPGNPDNANGGGSGPAGGKKEGGDNDAEMGEANGAADGAGAAAPGIGKAGDDKRRDSATGSDDSGDGAESSRRSSSGSDFMMEMEMDETSSDVSVLSDVDA